MYIYVSREARGPESCEDRESMKVTFLSDTDHYSCDGGRDWGLEETAGRGSIAGTHAGVVERWLGEGSDRKEFLVLYSWLSASASSCNSESGSS